ncbi:14340_t:CDS:1, partial [Entrophospora sp. SA101]
MSTNQEVYQYFYDLFELDLEEYEDYENVQEIIHNLMIFFKNPAK